MGKRSPLPRRRHKKCYQPSAEAPRVVAVEGKDQRDKPGKMAGAGTWALGTVFREIYAKAHTSVYSWSSRERREPSAASTGYKQDFQTDSQPPHQAQCERSQKVLTVEFK